MLWKNTDSSGSGPYVDAVGMLDADHITEVKTTGIIGAPNIRLTAVNTAWGTDQANNSLVLELVTKAGRFLFMSDAGEETVDRLLAGNMLLNTKFIKLGDYGSDIATSPNFLEATQPDVVFYFGDAIAPSLAARLEYEHVKIYSVRENGTICLAFSESTYDITAAD
jgi:beta-lactamase superfamily II metal-dependent hydrolase